MNIIEKWLTPLLDKYLRGGWKTVTGLVLITLLAFLTTSGILTDGMLAEWNLSHEILLNWIVALFGVGVFHKVLKQQKGSK
jgi:hypothetical protein